jgi:hypothetical protein
VSSSSSWRDSEAGGRQYHLVIVVSKKRYSYRKKNLQKAQETSLGQVGLSSFFSLLLFVSSLSLLSSLLFACSSCCSVCLLSLVMLCHRLKVTQHQRKLRWRKKKRKEKKKNSLSNRDYFLKKIDPAHHQKAMALWLGFGFSNPKPGQSHHEAIFTARLGLAYLGLAWPGSWPQAGPGTSLDKSDAYGHHHRRSTVLAPDDKMTPPSRST